MAQFLGLAIVIVFAGSFMTKAADVIGEKSGLGSSLAGLVLLAAATSLPEFAININAVQLPDYATGVDLAMGNILGSSLFNLLILGIIDLAFRAKQPMFTSVSAAHALSALASIALTAILLLFFMLHHQQQIGVPLSVGWIGAGSLGVGLFYLFSLRLIYLDQQVAAKLEAPLVAEAQENKMSLTRAIATYLIATIVIFVAARYLSIVADRVATVTGLGGSFVGSTFLALTTSLPEMVTTVVAVRMGASDMAIGNILGSNAFNIAIVLPVDAFYTRGAILADASGVHAVTAGAVIFVTCVATMGILYRADRRYMLVEPDALLVVLLVLASLYLIYRLTNGEVEAAEPRAPAAIEETSLRWGPRLTVG
ncbi:sodium:calcium antiporter [Blastopirellula retiformator]|nr:sodium:calcium antiporter [Blastopirellula retiformator]